MTPTLTCPRCGAASPLQCWHPNPPTHNFQRNPGMYDSMVRYCTK